MKRRTEIVPASKVNTKDRFGRVVTVDFPSYQTVVAPTLGKIHDWLWAYPFNYTWHDGWLCPFDGAVGKNNITCSAGRRARCLGTLITHDLINSDLPYECKQIGKVVCYPWAHRLTAAYWDIPTRDLLDLPDDAALSVALILRRVYKASGWMQWRNELARRKVTHRGWLRPL